MTNENGMISPEENRAAALTTNAGLPAFMAGTAREDFGLQDALQYVRPPRVKIVQPLSRPAIKEQFNDGDAIVVPTMQLLAPVEIDAQTKRPSGNGSPFLVVPIFFYPEFCVWNPLSLVNAGTLPTIRERSLDSRSPIAIRAKSQNREDICPENPTEKIKYVEHLNFIIMPLDGEFFGTPLVVSFSKAEFKTGSSFCASLQMRRAPIYGCVFQFQVKKRNNQKGTWFGFDITNPAPPSSPWLGENDGELFAWLKERHIEFREAHKNGLLQADYEDETQTIDASANATASGEY